jgi:glycosyltransferase involved in cell wall biosynthesis
MYKKAKIGIGMPIYNSEKTIRKAIYGILNQSCKDFELIISDNFSTDKTREICLEIAKEDPRIKYVQQEQNIGAQSNFSYVLDKSEYDYFMWHAGDDFIDDCSFFERALTILEKDVSVIGVSAQALISDDYAEIYDKGNQNIASSSTCKRISKFIINPGVNSRFYSLYRKKNVAQVYSGQSYWAWDIVFSISMLSAGKWIYLDDSSFIRKPGQSSDPIKLRVDGYGMGGMLKYFPYPRFIFEALRVIPKKCSVLIFPLLIMLYLRYLISPVKHIIMQKNRRVES